MKHIARNAIIALLGTSFALGATLVQAQTSMPLDRVYVIDQRGDVVVSGSGLCWRTGFWTLAAAANGPAGCKCDKDVLPREVCEPAAKAPAVVPASKPDTEKVTISADALFDFDKATLRDEGKRKLDDVVAKSKAINLQVVIVVGHADRFGSDAYNQQLSERRSAAVKEYLVAKGIEANRIYTEGKGEKQPVTKPNQCPGPKSKKVIDCLQPDRRVEIELIGNK